MNKSRGFAGIILLVLIAVVIIIGVSFSYVKLVPMFGAPQAPGSGY